MFPVKRQAGWWLIALVILSVAAVVIGWSQVVLRPVATNLLGPLLEASRGLVNPNLVFGLLALLLVVVVIMFIVGGMPAGAVGWVGRHAGSAFLVGIGLWAILQVVLVVVSLVGGHGLALAQGWSGGRAGYMLGALLAQVFGIALYEETVFRGFLFPQLAAKLPRLGRAQALVVGGLLSQLLFALSHVPGILLFQRPGGSGLLVNLLGLFLVGLWLAAYYMVTENLFVSVVVHALMNQPAALVQVDGRTTQIVIYALTILLLSAWGPLQDRLEPEPLTLIGSTRPLRDRTLPNAGSHHPT